MLLAALAILCIQSQSASWPQSQADWDWVNSHFAVTLDEFFPLPKDSATFVAFRSHRDLHTEEPEYSFIISGPYAWSAKLEAKVRMADGISLYDQIMVLHRKNPAASMENIKPKLKVKKWTLEESACPAIRSSAEKFQSLSFGPPKVDEITLHPLICEFKSDSASGRMNMVLADYSHPLVHWAAETRAEFEACIAKLETPKAKK